MIDNIRVTFKATMAGKAQLACWPGRCTFIPYMPKNTLGRATKIVARVRTVMVRFRLLLLIAR